MDKRLKIIPFYTGKKTLKDVLRDERSKPFLWLEILFNDRINWKDIKHPAVKEAYKKACIWHGSFRSLISSCIKRKPLELKNGQNLREERRFLETLNFVKP